MLNDCRHDAHTAFVDVYQLTATTDATSEPVGFTAEIRIDCNQCGEAFVFLGLPCGLSPAKPTTDVPGTTLRVPIKPASAPEDFGRDLPGFHVRFAGGNDQG